MQTPVDPTVAYKRKQTARCAIVLKRFHASNGRELSIDELADILSDISPITGPQLAEMMVEQA